MTRDWIGSKKESIPTRDESEINGSLGYVSAQEVKNAFTIFERVLDVEIWPKHGRMPDRNEVMEFFAALKQDLFRRAESRKPSPLPKAKTKSPDPVEMQTSQKAFDERKAKLQKWY